MKLNLSSKGEFYVSAVRERLQLDVIKLRNLNVAKFDTK
jgi:hypothetical protein